MDLLLAIGNHLRRGLDAKFNKSEVEKQAKILVLTYLSKPLKEEVWIGHYLQKLI